MLQWSVTFIKRGCEAMFKFLQGYKTYIMAFLIAVGAILKAYGIPIPIWVWTLLGAGGLGAVRAAIKKIEPVLRNK